MKFPARVYPHYEPEFLSDERPELDGEFDYEPLEDDYWERVDDAWSEHKDAEATQLSLWDSGDFVYGLS